MSPEEKTTDVGAWLRDLRHSKAIPLEEVVQKTKIRTVVLRQIESDDLDQMPSTFAKGFIRAYAEAIGADVQEALQRYEPVRPTHMPEEHEQAPADIPRNGIWHRLLPALALFAGLIAVSLYLAGRMPRQERSQPAAAAVKTESSASSPVEALPPDEHPSEPDKIPGAADGVNAEQSGPAGPVQTPVQGAPPEIETAPADATAQSAVPETPAPADNSTPLAGVAPDDEPPADLQQHAKLVLQLNAVALTWLKVARDEDPPREMTLRPDDQVTLEAQNQFDLLIGNAGGIRLTLNDRPVHISDKSGKVVRLHLP